MLDKLKYSKDSILKLFLSVVVIVVGVVCIFEIINFHKSILDSMSGWRAYCTFAYVIIGFFIFIFLFKLWEKK